MLESFEYGKGGGAFATPNPETATGAPVWCVALIKGHHLPYHDLGISTAKINFFKIIARLPQTEELISS